MHSQILKFSPIVPSRNPIINSKKAVHIHGLSNSQFRVAAAAAGSIQKSEEEWRAVLSPDQFRILRQKGTENPGSGEYNKFFGVGTYLCAGCGTPLYRSATKFNSPCGWPSFYEGLPGAINRNPCVVFISHIRIRNTKRSYRQSQKIFLEVKKTDDKISWKQFASSVHSGHPFISTETCSFNYKTQLIAAGGLKYRSLENCEPNLDNLLLVQVKQESTVEHGKLILKLISCVNSYSFLS